MQNKVCYLCGGTDFIKRSGSVRDNPSLEILECKNCGLVFLSSFDHIKQGFYENSNMFNWNKITIEEYEKTCLKDDERRYNQFKEAINGKSILDFGCGAAGFLKRAKTSTKLCVGLEIDKRYNDYYKENNLTVYDDLEQVEDKSIDNIFMFHVLEHLEDPVATLQALKNKLSYKNNGGG